MDDRRFDSLVRKFGANANRRALLRGAVAGGVVAVASRVTAAQAAPKDKVSICHRKGNGAHSLMQVNRNAYDAHIRHGDFEPYVCVDGPSCEECPIVDVPIFSCGPGIACPTGNSTFFPGGPLDPTSSEQARLACEACFGECFLNVWDCSGSAWSPGDPDNPECGTINFGIGEGCGAHSGSAWRFCDSSDPVGYWGRLTCP